MKRRLIFLGLMVSFIVAGTAQGFPEPEGVTWAEWRFTDDFDAAGEILADKSSAGTSLIRANAASSAISLVDGAVLISETGPADYLRVDIDDLMENGGGYVNEYTMIFDIKALNADWLPIYNTGYDNYNAAELWVAGDGSVGSGSYSDAGAVPLDSWGRGGVVRRLEGGSWVRDVYVDGTLVFDNLGSEGADGNASLYTNAQQDEGQFTIISDSDATAYGGAELDSFAFVAMAYSDEDIAALGAYNRFGIFGATGVASNPGPADAGADVPRDTSLSWTPKEGAQTRNVYLGTNWDDVNSADMDVTLSVLVSEAQDANSYVPDALFAFGQTYYWRVDEVNGAPDRTVFKGDIWSFTVESYAYTITPIAATASSMQNADMAPTKTIDGSGLNELDQHSTEPKDMWLSGAGGESPWIQYEFDDVYKLHEMWIWNSNQLIETFVGLGAKDVTVETSTDGATWAVLAGVAPLAQAPGTEGYAHNNTIDFAGAMAQYVRLTINSGFGVMPQYGLSEVRFFYIPAKAREPQPASAATSAGVDVVLSWRAGREAAAHQVSFGKDSEAVANGTAVVGTVSENQFDLKDQSVEFGTTYFWKVDEVNEAGSPKSYAGDLWSFSTPEYAVVDNFDQYDNDCARIFFTWLDGLGHSGSEDCAVNPYDGNLTGSIVGNASAPFAERDTVVAGQSMPLEYDNSFAPFYSEAESVAFALPSDWTTGGADTLALSVRGYPAKFTENPATGIVTMSGAGADIWGTSGEFRFAYQRLNGDGSMAVKVESLLDTDSWAKAGVMIRESLDPEAKHAMVVVTPGNSVSFQRRTAMSSDMESTDQEGGLTAPYWVRLTRSGDALTAQSSADGATWDTVGSVNIAMVSDVYIGLALTSHSAGNATVAEFSNVTRSGSITGVWQTEDVGVDQPANEAAPLYIAVEDSANKIQVIEHSDAEAVLTPTWQTWSIPLSDLNAVDLARIKKLYIGVGDRNSPQAGGAGKLYIDNIRVGKPTPLPAAPPAQVFINTDFEANAALVPNADDTAAGPPDGWEYDRYYGYDIDPWLANVSNVGDGSGGEVAVVLGTWNGDSAWHPVVAAYDLTPVVPAAYTLELTMAATGGAGDRSLSQGRVDVQFGWLADPEDPWSNYGELVRTWTDVTAEFGTDTWGTKTWNFEISPNDEAVGKNWYLWLRGESYDDHVLIGGVKVTPILE